MNLPRGTVGFNRVWTDTRTIEPGDLFVALVGEKFDAHDFLRDAVANGATGIVVSRMDGTQGIGVPVWQTDDTLVALGALATYRRRAWNQPVVGVVGTNGKTSTKELIKAALGSVLNVHATAGNFNNLIGVPLTLLSIPDGAEVAVVEMGTNQPGEVATLRAIVEPTIVAVTSIGEEHLEGLGDLAGVLREEIAAVDEAQVAIVPASQPEVGAAAKGRATRVVSAGLDSGDLMPSSWRVAADGHGELTLDGVEVRVPLNGAHNLRNAMIAFAVARELGVSVGDAARGIADMPLPKMRVNIEQLGAATLINDAYNSNPPSARAAIELLVHTGAGRPRVAVLATMLELGPTAAALHDAVARDALAAGIETVGAIGEFAAAFDRVAPGDARVVTAADAEALWPALSSRLLHDAVILLKGSRGMRLERLVQPITEWARGHTGGTASDR
ncbi:MAG: UDP-N-acetylmuramoyl-tripeptide--D-alanyl-D-alanine ligase [Gemmatimonadaceae bacterium]